MAKKTEEQIIKTAQESKAKKIASNKAEGKRKPPRRVYTYYKTHVQPFLATIRKLAADGYTDTQIAEALGVNPQTFRDWKAKPEHEELREALRYTKQMTLDQLEATALLLAMGKFPERTVQTVEDTRWDKDKKEYITYISKRTTTEVYKPRDAQLIFLLKSYSRFTGEFTDIPTIDTKMAQVEDLAMSNFESFSEQIQKNFEEDYQEPQELQEE